VAIYGPKVMIVNELAGSGGDAFPWFFHRQKSAHRRTRTWGGLVGISRSVSSARWRQRHSSGVCLLVHGQWGEWIVENHGVDPDFVVSQRRT